jgi:predicted transglutaminase-like cysteine proteinase
MLTETGARHVARSAFVLALAAGLALALATPAAAARKAKKKAPVVSEFGFTAALSFSAPSPVPSARAPATTPLRFFTINQVLAKQDRIARVGDDNVRLAALPPVGTLSDAPASAPPARGEEPFGMTAFRAPEGVLWAKWRTVERGMTAEAFVVERCRAEPETCPSAAALRFIALTATAREKSGRARLEHVTHAVNAAVRYTSDIAQHGVADLWSAPLVTLANGRGDCEDYAIAKYAILRAAGVAADDLRVVLLRDTASREDHAVLAARENGRWFILDNRRAGFYEDRALPHYMPLFAVGTQGVQVYAAPFAARPVHESETVSPAMADGELAGGSVGDRPVLM